LSNLSVRITVKSRTFDTSGDEEDKDEDEELAYDDDEQDVDDINHPHSDSSWKKKGKLETRRSRLGE
jgi:hypothetical protein